MALDELFEIPGNRQVFDDLVALLREHRGIAFVGAGASAGMYPLWGQFIGQLADYAVQQGKADPADADRWRKDTNSTPQQRVKTILRRLPEPEYHQFLKKTFEPRMVDGKRYTPSHSLLMRLPFRGYVTTNYDPALEFARAELRPECLTTGTPTWQDDDEVHAWLTGDAHRDPDGCPILWLHGYWQRPATIVLNAGEYAKAYRASVYRRTFEKLWIQDRLVFVGFGFNDPQFTFMVGEMLHDIASAHAVPRHIALLSVKQDDDGNWPDAHALREQRANMEEDYHVRPLFYRVTKRPDGSEDHSELFALLEQAAVDCDCARPVPSAIPSTTSQSTSGKDRFSAHWEHETTDDQRFTGREEERARLDRWVRDESVRIIGICAVGGTGKTALIGHWLKHTRGWRSRLFAGLFAWSFYQERDPAVFLMSLLNWASAEFGTPKPHEKTDLVGATLAVLRQYPLVLVLDGLEVLQEDKEDSRHGAFLSDALRGLLTALCGQECESLAVLTSRFVFADLERYLGTAFHQLELHGLLPEQGAELLTEFLARGPKAEREEISRRLDGHPLGLRVFAEALPMGQRDHPLQFLEEAFLTGDLPADATLAGKVQRLLTFYQEKLPERHVQLLSVVSLFRSPVPEETILRILGGLFAPAESSAPSSDAEAVGELRTLHRRGILTREPIEGGHGYAAHPIFRDHFRRVLLVGCDDAAARAAELLTGSPADVLPEDVREIEPVLLAIELLLDAGEFRAADELYRARLENGSVFHDIPAYVEGVRCARHFVSNATRQWLCEVLLSLRRRGFYLTTVGLCASISGDYGTALYFLTAGDELFRNAGDVRALSGVLRVLAVLRVYTGHLKWALEHASESVKLISEFGDARDCPDGHTHRGTVVGLLGRGVSAAEDFSRANVLERRLSPFGDELYSIRGVWWSEWLLRCEHCGLSQRRAIANRAICGRHDWSEDVARCSLVLGKCALAERRLDDTEQELERAEPIFRRGSMLFELAQLHLCAGELALARGDRGCAHRRVAGALDLAAPRGMRLVHADALVLRGRIRVAEAAELTGDTSSDLLYRAADDAEEALRLARDSGYAWAERDALSLQADVGFALADLFRKRGEESTANRRLAEGRAARTEAVALSAKLRVTDADFAEADPRAEEWLKEWEQKHGPARPR